MSRSASSRDLGVAIDFRAAAHAIHSAARSYPNLFFLEDGRSISDPEITRWRWSESIKALTFDGVGPTMRGIPP